MVLQTGPYPKQNPGEGGNTFYKQRLIVASRSEIVMRECFLYPSPMECTALKESMMHKRSGDSSQMVERPLMIR